MEKILPITLKLNFTPNTLGCYRLNKKKILLFLVYKLRFLPLFPSAERKKIKVLGGPAILTMKRVPLFLPRDFCLPFI